MSNIWLELNICPANMNIVLSISGTMSLIYLFKTISLSVQRYLIIFSKYYISKLIDIYRVPYVHHLFYT